jgi:tetratricopeptide (TPR) repeat protein
MPLTERCCASLAARYTAELRKHWKRSLPILPKASQSCLHATAPRLAGLKKPPGLWGKAGQRSLERSALVEAVAQLTRAIDQIAVLPPTPALRREEIKLQVALINPLLHVKGYAAPEIKKAAERARLLIDQAEALGEPPEDPLLLFSVLYAFWVANVVAFKGDAARELAAQFLALAKQQGTTAPQIIGHRLMGMSFLELGEIAKGREHLDSAIALYNPAEHRPLATRFGHDPRVSILCFRSMALWLLGYPEAARQDAYDAVDHAREIGQAATLMYALIITPFTHFLRSDYATANAQLDEAIQLADEKDAVFWKAWGMMQRGCVLALTGKPCCRDDDLRNQRVAVNRINSLFAALSDVSGEGLRHAWPVR